VEQGESDASAAASGSGGSVYAAAPASPRAGTFVGLQNQGATCYLNSLIVSLYMTPEIRRGLYLLSPTDLVVPLSAAEAAAEDEKKASAEPPIDQTAVEALCGMGFEEVQVKRAIRRFPNDPDNMQRVEYILSGDAEKEPAAAGPAVAPENRVKERRIPKVFKKRTKRKIEQKRGKKIGASDFVCANASFGCKWCSIYQKAD
jgi:uncharacterized UBP type Zn finger protein